MTATTLGIGMLVTAIGLVPMPRPADPDACSLLTEAQTGAAIDVKVGPGKHQTPSSTKTCMWTDAPTASVDHRRVVLTISAPAAFDFGKQNGKIKTEPASGAGDEAYYEFFGADAPILVVKKGGTVFTVRVLDGLKLKPLGLDVVKAKELELAKAAAAKL